MCKLGPNVNYYDVQDESDERKELLVEDCWFFMNSFYIPDNGSTVCFLFKFLHIDNWGNAG